MEGDKINKIKIIIDYNIKSLSQLFLNLRCIEKINFINFCREDINDMSYMFYNCTCLTTINFNNFNTDNVTNMSFMFSGCEKLTSIDLSKFNTKKVTNMIYMFSFCKQLKSINLSKFDINKSTHKDYMLVSCSNLQKVIINKNFLEDIEKLINDPNFIKKNYYLTNSIQFKSEKSIEKKYFKYINNELHNCLFEKGFQIINLIDDTITGVLEGPISSNYENGFFFFKMKWNDHYPFRKPEFYFTTKIFHPNISEEDGLVSYCNEDEWTPALRSKTVILTVQALLGNPNIDDFLNQEAAKLYKENKKLYDETVKDYVKKYANYSIYKNKLKEYEVKHIYKIIDN